jgi:mono/diheme cytochrome c family protein
MEEEKGIFSSGKFWTAFVLSWFLLSPVMAGPVAASTPIDSITKKDPLVSNGKQLYADLKCSYCHSLKGQGGTVGPALDNVGFRRTKEWMADHFRNPKTVTPGTKMAKMKLRASQVGALVAYMNSLGGYTFTPQAAGLFKDHCSNCHSLNETSAFTNDLSQEKRFRDMDFLMDYISDPAGMNGYAKMGGFKGVLTRAQIKDVAAYIYQQGR